MINERTTASLAFVANTKKKEKNYWLNRLSGQPSKSTFPYDNEKENSYGYSLNTSEFIIPEDISSQFIRLSKGNPARLFTFLTTGVFILLWKYTGNTDLLLGIPVTGTNESAEIFNSALPIRFFIDDRASFPNLLSQLGQTLIEAEKHQNFPVRLLSDLLGFTQKPDEGFPLFDVVVLLQDIHFDLLTEFSPGISFIFANTEQRIEGRVRYNSFCYKPETIIRLINHYKILLEILIANPQGKMADIELLSADEKRQILECFNDTEAEFPEHSTVYELFDRQADQTPHANAVIYKEQKYSYRQLKRKTDHLAMALKQRGVGYDSIIAVKMGHIPEMVVALVGILKSGAAYLPIAMDYPAERIDYILKDSGAKLLVTTENLEEVRTLGNKEVKANNGTTIFVNVKVKKELPNFLTSQPPNFPLLPATSLAYIMYTSGSTGKPKGVMINHRSFVEFTTWAVEEFEHRPGYQVLLSNSYASDGSIQQIYPPLISGGTLHLIDKELRLDVRGYLEYLKTNRINNIDEVPVLMKELVALFDANDSEEKLPDLTCLSLGSEYVPIELIRNCRQHLNHNGRIINAYGPAEASVETTTYHCDGTLEDEQSLIGKPRRNLNVFILDANGHLCPIGVRGEICISGVGLARGYLNRPQLTAEKFTQSLLFLKTPIDNLKPNLPHLPAQQLTHSTIYRTGDMGCWNPDGNIRFFGRMDDQIKIRGNRVEIREIENVLKSHKEIKDAVVITRENDAGEIEICGYYIGNTITNTLLREYLEKRLPLYMIPAHLLELEKIPMTPHGKVDKKALPLPVQESFDGYVPPRNDLEKQLVEIWSDVLNRSSETIGIHTDFFKAGGHSLKVVKLTSRIQKQLGVEISIEQIFKTSTINTLVEYLETTKKSEISSIQPVELKEYYELTPVQKRLYILQQMAPDSTVYNIPAFLNLSEPIEKDRLTEIFKRLIQRHEILRTSFALVNEEPVQRIHSTVKFEIEHHHVIEDGAVPAPGSFVRPFDLSKAPMLRVGLINIKEQYILAVDMHHIVCDPVSHEVLSKEFNALCKGETLPIVKLQYTDYAGWQNSQYQKAKIKKQESYWLSRLGRDIPVLELPLDFPRPQIQSFAGDSIEFVLGQEDTQQLKNIAPNHNVTVFMIVLGVLNVLLSKLSGNEDILVGIPITTRHHEDLTEMIGMFINTLVLRNEPAGHKPFLHFLQEVKVNTSSAFSNADYPFEELVEKLDFERDTGRNPLFDVTFNYLNESGDTIGSRKVENNIAKLYENSTSKFDFTLTAIESNDTLLFSIEYCTRLFKTETIQRMIDYFRKVISSVCEKPNQKLSELEIISQEEKNRLLTIFNDRKQQYPGNKTIHGLIETQAEQTPDTISLTGIHLNRMSSWSHISYRELNKQTGHLATLLLNKSVEHFSIVGIMVGPSIEMIIGILGILKAGCAYLPIDPESPPDRIQYIIKDSKIKILISNREPLGTGQCADHSLLPGDVSILDLVQSVYHEKDNCKGIYNQNKLGTGNVLWETGHCSVPTDLLAYIIYTSGSTGKPKGVPITHSNFSPLIHWGYTHLGIGPNERTLQNVSYFFDWSVWEIFITLTTGASLYIVDREVIMNPEKCIDFILMQTITILHITPGQLSYLLHTRKELKTLRYLFIGAEKLTHELINRILNSINRECRIFNMYGPTETTIISTTLEIDRHRIENYKNMSSVPIGAASGNLVLLILDKYFNLCPLRVTGELMIGGDGVSRGYLNNPELTNEKFLATEDTESTERVIKKKILSNPNSPTQQLIHSTLYRTGDLARWHSEGNIEFIGRIDHQVKIRGFRIELGEIENRLLRLPGIKEAIVLCHEDSNNEKYLCGYIVSKREYTGAELNQLLSDGLPDYMIPSYFERVKEIPLTPNGKIDRRALPKPEFNTGDNHIPPRNELERKLVKIWSDVLMIPQEKTGIDDHFFQVGGHSLKATIMVSKIQKDLNIQVPLAEIFKHSTIRTLAELISATEEIKIQPIIQVEKKEFYPLSSAQKRLYILQQMDPESTAYNMPAMMWLIGELDAKEIESAVKQLIRRHDSLRTSFHLVHEEPVQKIHQEIKFEIENPSVTIDGEVPSPGSFIRPFDLSQAPLIRIGLIQSQEKKYQLMIDMNHIISDGTSMGILVNEFMAFYAGEEPGPLKIQYRDWAHWQSQGNKQLQMKTKEDFWLNQFEGKVPVLNLPNDYTRPQLQDFEGEQIRFVLSAGQTESINALAVKENVTLYMILLSVYYILLYKVTGQEDIVIGTPTAGRIQAELQNIIGMFLNTLALRNFPKGGKPINIFLSELKETVLQTFANQEYQFDDLVDRLGIKRGGNRNPLFDVMFILQNQEKPEIRIPGLQLIPMEIEQISTKFDISLYAEEIEQELVFVINYRKKLFKPSTIAVLVEYFKSIFDSILENSGQTLDEIDIITKEKRTSLLMNFNHDLEREAKELIAEGFFQAPLNKSVQHFKNNIALDCESQSLSYGELECRSNHISHWIVREGIVPETFIGILIQSRINFIITMTGILKAGCVIVPLYSELPVGRLEEMARIIGLKHILIDRINHQRIHGSELEKVSVLINPIERVNHDENMTKMPPPTVNYNGAQQCYIYFTSGSTGKPKPIIGKNISLLHFVNWEIKTFGINNNFCVSQLSLPIFDPFLRDVFVPLLAGAKICIPREKAPLVDSDKLVAWMDRKQISLIHCVPTLFRLLSSTQLNPKRFKHLKLILMAGEKINPNDLVEWYTIFGDRIQLVNLYGSTETTMIKFYHLIKPEDIYLERIPVGHPMIGSRVIMLNKTNQPCSPLQTGEICVRTPFGSFGYYNNPGLNREKFINNPFNSNSEDILYRTGDQGRMLADGKIDILGRIDRQVKIRGYRIELEEVERVLVNQVNVEEAAVILKGESPERHYLCAYITVKHDAEVNGEFDSKRFTGNLKHDLSNQLPHYMVPAIIIILDTIPKKMGGKVDYKKLAVRVDHQETEFIAPQTDLEKRLVKIWTEILKNKTIGISDDFFELGGNSLSVVALVAKIQREFSIKITVADLFKNQTVEKQAQLIKISGKVNQEPPKAVEEKEYYPLSSSQKRLVVLQQIDTTRISYNISHQAQLEGVLDIPKFQSVLRQIIRRHDSLRTSIHLIQEEPVQRIHKEIQFELNHPSVNLDGEVPSPGSFIQPFDLSQAPLIRFFLIKTGQNIHMLMVDMHHIITDGMSIMILYRDIMDLYNERELPPLKLSYSDFSLWQNHRQQKMKRENREQFWLDQFQGEIPVLNLPLDFPRPSVKQFEGTTINFTLEETQTAALKRIATTYDVTLYMVLLSIISIFLSKLSGQEEVVVGTPIAGRTHPDLEQLIGMFVNTLTLKNTVKGEKNVASLLREVKRHTLECYENQEYPFEQLVEKLSPPIDLSRNPLFDVMFVLQNMEQTTMEIPGLKLTPVELEKTTARFDLNFMAYEGDKQIHFTLEYSTRLFKRETIKRFIGYLSRISDIVGERPENQISQIDILSQTEKYQLLVDFNQTEVPYERHSTIHELVAAQVGKTPENTALFGNMSTLSSHDDKKEMNGHITYSELNGRANRLALVLAENGITGGTIAGILMNRSVEMIIGILGILKAGGIYLPLDPDYPKGRIDYMLKDSKVNLVLTEDELSTLLELPSFLSVPSVLLSGNFLSFGQELIQNPEGITKSHDAQIKEAKNGLEGLNRSRTPSASVSSVANYLLPATNHRSPATSLAYVIYTSGSTGKPKGVLITHCSLVNFISGIHRIIPMAYNDVLYSLTPVCFDIFGLEIFAPLTAGSTLVIGSREEQTDTELAGEAMLNRQVTVFQATPSRLTLMISGKTSVRGITNLRYLLVGGEALPEYLLEQARNITTGRLFNLYGPTETTIWSTAKELTGEVALDIGKPIANTHIYILDNYLTLSPFGVPGELFIGGDGLSIGYVNNPELTIEKFLATESTEGTERVIKKTILSKPNSPTQQLTHSTIYRTGDLARWLPDGNIAFLGRLDHQVKVRGFRIELGEIENQLLQYPGINKAIVVAQGRGTGTEKQLCAYFVSSEPINIKEVRDRLSKELPGYMVPSFFVQLEMIPLTPNGKVDRKALPKPEIETASDFIAPRNEAETGIVYILSEILGIDKSAISVRANFFEIGINSMSLMRLAHRLSQEFNIDIPMSILFTSPSVEGVVAYLKKDYQPGESSRAILLNKKTAGRNLFLISGDGRIYIFKELAKLLEGHFNVYGVLAKGIMDTGDLPETRNEIYEDFLAQIRHIQPEGPYLLGGHCFGTMISYEITRILEERKNTVTKLIFIDEPALMVDKIFDYFLILRWYNKSKHAIETFKTSIQSLKMNLTGERPQKQPVSVEIKTRAMPQDLEARRIQVDKNYRRLLSGMTHFSRIVKTPMLVIKAEASDQDPDPRWNPNTIARQSRNKVELVKIPGEHYSIFDPPYVSGLAEQLIKKI